MNPKEVSYSHPQLPLCDTPNCLQIQSFTGIETQKYRFFGRMQESSQKIFTIIALLFALPAAYFT
jgi:hypothetical protein